LDLNDPDFLPKLHDKYFPDLPKEIDKLKWMEPIPVSDDQKNKSFVYDNVDQLRFDFKGNLINPNNLTPLQQNFQNGLYNHADSPNIPGYSLSELSRLSRSNFQPQRCIAIQTLGRILYKLSSKKYDNILQIEDHISSDESELDEFYNQAWKTVHKLRIIDSLSEASDENLTRNLSVRNYALDALWLWKQGESD
ncbi:Rba50p ASCRUDRAFT_19520, partial [Ascoidea rubescens DSM 1968]